MQPDAQRELVLARIRAALARRPVPSPAPAPVASPARAATRADRLAHFAVRAGAYRATVHRVPPDGVAELLRACCAARGATRVRIPTDLPRAWRPEGVELVIDTGLSPAALDGLDGALTGCALAIAETGTIVLDGGPGQGRRALTLVPDWHGCVVRAEQVVDDLPDAVAALAAAAARGRPLTFVSGPSATSDIELDRVEGVHGPRRLDLVVVG